MIGKVFLAKSKIDKKYYAIKSMRKDRIVEYKLVEKTIVEKDILFGCHHPFICRLDYVFQDEDRLYFVMPFCRGGELYKVVENQGRLSEKVVQFYAA